ncbi:uncharacterized protein LOC117115645 [Anneissia japonica]|uniref:uncharacterized protein LOC117115645 n=1 Tax=Anneissia japonica TaxID=1529436 RepID=UPI0014256236|nr:uncharacterized protein LOC117115645 [Anneissia japonica]XP_033115423.1 uncharacterized protein LOC117115645 [Anneissia japonica]XP_033115424.1 uncharacterized protein LOC117115645 [Anneissia japonica]XP_033115425.1 uncharacterized protein LOC117115645 [Anneissia japonica]
MTSPPKKGSESFAEVTVIDSQYNHFRDYVDIIRVYKCKLCPFCSPLEHVITSHMSEVHFPRRCFLCKQCLFVFESREQLIEHIEAGHGLQSLNFSFGEPTSHCSQTQAPRLGSTVQGEERSGRKALDDGGVNGQSVTSSTSNLANIPDDPASNQPNQKDDLSESPGLSNEIVLRRPPTVSPEPSPVSHTSSSNLCTSSSQESQGRHHDKTNSGQLMGLGVRKMLQRRHSLGGSLPNSELRVGFFSQPFKEEPISPVLCSKTNESLTGTNQQEVRPVMRDVTPADSLADSSESKKRDSISRNSVVSCPEEMDLRSKDSELSIALPPQRDVAVVRGIPFRPETAENVTVKQEKMISRENMELELIEKGSGSPSLEDQKESSDSPDLTFNETFSRVQAQPETLPTLELGVHRRSDPRTDPKLDTRTEPHIYQRDKPPASLRDIVSHVMEKHRHNNVATGRPTENHIKTPPQTSVEFPGNTAPGIEYHGSTKTRPRSYSITEGEIPNFHDHQDDLLDSSKEGLRSDLHGHPTDHKQYRGGPPNPRMPLWYHYHQQSLEREQGKYPRMVPWAYPGHFPGGNQSQNSSIGKITAPQSSEESVLYRYLRNPHPHMKRRRNSIGVMNPVEAARVGLPWPPQLPPNEMISRFVPPSQPHMPWGAVPGYMQAYGLPPMGDKVNSPNSIAKHGSQVSPNRYGEYLADMERKEGNKSNNSDQTSSEGTQDLAQVDDITRQVNSAIRSTGGFYASEQNGGEGDDGNHDFDGEDDENRSDDGRKRSRKSTFNIYREIPERKRKLDRVEEEKIKKSYNADGSFDYFTLTGWKAYKCDLCKKRRFKTASELEDHKRLKHGSDLNQNSRKLVFHSVHVEENDFEESS